MSNKADLLSQKQLNDYGLKLLRWYWDALKQKPTADFNSFVDQIYYDAQDQKNYREEDLPALGKSVAMYLLDHPFPDEKKLQSIVEELANRTPTYKIPTKWALGQTIVEAAKEVSFFDYFTISKNIALDTEKSFKELSLIPNLASGVKGLGNLFAYSQYIVPALLALAAFAYFKSMGSSHGKLTARMYDDAKEAIKRRRSRANS